MPSKTVASSNEDKIICKFFFIKELRNLICIKAAVTYLRKFIQSNAKVFSRGNLFKVEYQVMKLFSLKVFHLQVPMFVWKQVRETFSPVHLIKEVCSEVKSIFDHQYIVPVFEKDKENARMTRVEIVRKGIEFFLFNRR